MNYNWDLKNIYESKELFDKDLKRFKEEITPKCEALEGKLNDDEKLKEFLELEREISSLVMRLYLYVACNSDLNKKDVARNEALTEVSLAYEDFSRKVSWSEPELIALGQDHINKFIEENPDFSDFDFNFKQMFLGQKHILNPEKEKLMSIVGPCLGEGGQLYSMLSVGDYSPKKCTLSNGEEVEVSLNNWNVLITEAPTAEDRQLIFETLYSFFEEHKNIYGEIYNSILQSELATMRARGYKDILETHIYEKNIPESVFLNLIDVASKNSAPLKKYYELRKKALGLENHRSYDRFLELSKSDKKYTFEDSKDMFFDSIKNFPEDFQEKAHEVLKEGYVDVYPQDGKRTGAYSTGGANIHPFILLNFVGELDDVFTVAHESGHSIHTLYSMESQPLVKQDYTIFVAEIASTFNEHNLLDYMLEKGNLSHAEKIALLQKSIDEICGTFYRQTLFGHYEYNIAKKAEAGLPINYQTLSNEMTSLYKTYYGIDIEEEKVKPFVWAYIPHLFYTPFYVYQYATSFTASMLIYENVKAGKEGAFENYINLLRSGGSDYPINQVKNAGVDLTSKEPFLAVVKRMEELVDMLEEELNKAE